MSYSRDPIVNDDQRDGVTLGRAIHNLGPNFEIPGSTTWNPPYKVLNDGKNAIIGFGENLLTLVLT